MTNAEATAILELIAANLLGIVRGIEDIKRMLRSISKQENREMATLAEVKADVEEMRVEAAHNADVAASAMATLQRVVSMIGEAAASASDLDGLKASLDEITATVHDSAQSLGDAIATVP